MQFVEQKLEWIDYRQFSPYNLQCVLAYGSEPYVEDGRICFEKSIRLCQFICGINCATFIQIPSLCEKIFELQNVTHWMPLPLKPLDTAT